MGVLKLDAPTTQQREKEKEGKEEKESIGATIPITEKFPAIAKINKQYTEFSFYPKTTLTPSIGIDCQ